MIRPVCVDRVQIRKCPQVLVVIPFHQEKELRVATLFFSPPFLLGGAPFPPLFGWKEKFTTTKPSTLIKSAAKPSTTKEHNIWGRWVIPPLNLEAGTEFQMSIITAGEGSEGRRHTDTRTHAHTRTVMKINVLLTISPLQQSRTKMSFISECHTVTVSMRIFVLHRGLKNCIFKGTDLHYCQIFDHFSGRSF